MDAEEPIEVYSTNNANEAELIRSMLQGEGIPSQVTGENQAGLAGVFPISIVVRATDYDRAKAFIDAHQEQSDSTDEEEDMTE